jgi:hypothetical protein
VAAAVGFQRRQLVDEQALGVMQQASDQRALAVVDAAAGDEAQQPWSRALQVAATVGDAVVDGASSEVALLLLLLHRRGRIVVDHRPCRSDVVATSISR